MFCQATKLQGCAGARVVRTAVSVCSVVVIVSCVALACRADDEKASSPPSKQVLESVEKKIGKEPKYAATPRYALLVLGPAAKSKVWIVEDGDVLYVDKNANGDLTDDGPPISQSDVREFEGPDGKNGDCNYVADAITTPDGTKHTDFDLRRWKYGKAEVEYGLSLSLDGKIPMYAGWFGTFLAAKPADVPLLHFGGPLTPTKLSGKQFVLDAPPAQLDTAYTNPGLGKGATTYLSMDALPKEIVPEVQIDWPVAPGAEPVRTVERLTERCCYWNYYKKGFQIPPGVVEGEAVLTFSFPNGELPLELATDRIKVRVRSKGGK